MLSGAVLLGKEENIITFTKKRVLRIILVIIIFTFLQYIRLIIAGKETFSLITYFIYLYSGNIIEPYWYLKAYLGFVLAVPFLRIIAKNLNRELVNYLLILSAIKILTSLIFIYCGYATNIYIEFTVDILLYPLLGFALEQGLFSMKKTLSIPLFFVLILSSVLQVYWNYSSTKVWNNELMTLFIIPITALFYSIFMSFKYTNKFKAIILLLGPCVFGVYLIEDIIRNIVEFRINFYSLVSIPILNALLFSIVCEIIGLFIVYIVRKVPLIRKII